MNFKRYSTIKTTLAALLLVFGATSCDKDEDTLPMDEKAQVSVVNLVEGSTAINAHLGGTKINTTAIAYGESANYIQIDAGTEDLSIFESGETDTLARVSHNFKREESFSAFVIGTEAEATVVVSGDNLTAPASGKTKLRFINLVDNDELLNLWLGEINEEEDALFAEVAFKGVKDFVEIDANSDLDLLAQVNGGDLQFTFENANLAAGSIYTVYAWEKLVEGEKTVVLSLVKNK